MTSLQAAYVYILLSHLSSFPPHSGVLSMVVYVGGNVCPHHRRSLSHRVTVLDSVCHSPQEYCNEEIAENQWA